MYLREIIIDGFKSFVRRTRVPLSPGITMIVGPNGCGKSNIVDAIRWVLGEKSVKSLRGEKMQDVIFEGTEKRGLLPFCDVTLVLSDCESVLNAEFNEVSVSRRVWRDGRSEYRLNGRPCRLKDIQLLFLDTGIGRFSYSFMIQGHIDQILSSRPTDRRSIFEEAAGISKYKAQRDETLSKLKGVEENLSRVTDIMAEVTRQLSAIKRRASKAERYKRIRERLKYLDLAYNGYCFHQREQALGSLDTEAKELNGKLAKADTCLQERKARWEARKKNRSSYYEDLQEREQAVYHLRSRKEQRDKEAQLALLRQEDTRKRIKTIAQEQSGIGQQQEAIKQQLAQRTANRQRQLDRVEASDRAFQSQNAALLQLEQQLAQLEKQKEETAQKGVQLENSLTALRARCTRLEWNLETYQMQQKRLKADVLKLEQERSTFKEQLKHKHHNRVRRQQDDRSAQAALEAIEKERERLREALRKAQAAVQEIDREQARCTARLHVLETLRFEGFSTGGQAILQGKLSDTLPEQDYVLLMQALHIDPAFTRPLEVLLGPAIDAIRFDEPQKAARILSLLHLKQLGRACLQIPAPRREQGDAFKGQLPQGMFQARQCVCSRDPAVAESLELLLRDCYIGSDLETFLAFWERQPQFDFLLAATQRGELIERRGLIYGGRSKDEKHTVLQREQERRRLKKEQTTCQSTLERLQREADQLQKAFQKAESESERQRRELGSHARVISVLQAEEQAAAQQLKQSEDKWEEAKQALQQLEKSHQASCQAFETAKTERKSIESQVEQQRGASQAVEDALVAVFQEHDQQRETLSDVRVDLAEQRQRLEWIDKELAETEKMFCEAKSRMRLHCYEQAALHTSLKTLEKEEKLKLSESTALTQKLEESVTALKKKRDAYLALEHKLEAEETYLNQEREQRRKQEQALHTLEVKRTEERVQQRFLLEKVQAEYQIELDRVNWQQALKKAEETGPMRPLASEEARENAATDPSSTQPATPDWESVADEISQLRERLTTLGPVDLSAIEEYAKVEERYHFLKHQSDDLWKAKNALVKAIRDLNRTSCRLFETTFEQIRELFKTTFRELFGGGFADLQLLDAEDVLDSGIEIIVRPPGTKLNHIAALSGGQKAMTAVALLFAIYKIKPSPFCILDELDASLDDANINRFVGLLHAFAKKSQFLIISHNRRTIAAADTLYGVTMQERGVTELLSMRFDQATQPLEPAMSETTTDATGETGTP